MTLEQAKEKLMDLQKTITAYNHGAPPPTGARPCRC